MVLWLLVSTSDRWVHRIWYLGRSLWLLTAAVAAAGAAMATVAAAWATTLVTAAAARLTAVTAATAWLATVAATVMAATVMATVAAAAFLRSFSSSSPLRLTAVCLLHYGCNGQDTWVICLLRYRWASWLGAWTAIAVASLSAVPLTMIPFCIISILALTLLRLDTFLRFTRWRTVAVLFFVALTFFHILLGTIAVFLLYPLLCVCWYFTGAFICICLLSFICSKKGFKLVTFTYELFITSKSLADMLAFFLANTCQFLTQCIIY